MSAEKIIQRIQEDAEKEARNVLDIAKEESDDILDSARKESQSTVDAILLDGKTKAENVKKVMLSQASQEVKKDILNAKEKLIEECFSEASDDLSSLKGDAYKKISKRLIEAGKKRISGDVVLYCSRPADRDVAKAIGIAISGSVEGSGGVIICSKDGAISVDNTFEGILERKKDEIRIEVGRLLFP